MANDRSDRDVSLDYLRATLTVLVVAHHSSLAYTTFASSDPGNYQGGTAPIVDAARWIVLDHAENLNDVFFMSAMFFISGLFVWRSLKRHGATRFLRDRFVRLGLPFALGVLVLMPVAYYAAWLFSGGAPDYLAYWRNNLLRDGFTPGPLWFLWVLLLFDVVAAATFLVARNLDAAFERVARLGETRPLVLTLAILILCAAAYLPALAVFGFDAWRAFFTGPFYFQTSRFGLYLVWFVIGCVLGAKGITRGLLNPDGPMARHGGAWFAAAVVIYLVMEFVPRAIFDAGLLPMARARPLYDVLWVASCVASTLGFLALFRQRMRTRSTLMNSLARCAYGVYVVHYIYVLWIQYALLETPLHAGLKFLLTFAGALALSWASASLMLCIRPLRRVL